MLLAALLTEVLRMASSLLRINKISPPKPQLRTCSRTHQKVVGNPITVNRGYCNARRRYKPRLTRPCSLVRLQPEAIGFLRSIGEG